MTVPLQLHKSIIPAARCAPVREERMEVNTPYDLVHGCSEMTDYRHHLTEVEFKLEKTRESLAGRRCRLHFLPHLGNAGISHQRQMLDIVTRVSDRDPRPG